MTFCIACKRSKHNIPVDLAISCIRRCQWRQYRAINGGCTICPSQCLRKVPYNFSCIFSGCCNTITKDLITAKLYIGSSHIDQYGCIQWRNNIDAIQLVQRYTCTVNIAAVKIENIQIFIDTSQCQLIE